FYLQLTCIKSLTGDAQKISYVYTYGNLSTVFDQTEQLDSMQKYIELQLNVLRDFDEKNAAAMYLGVYNDLGQLHVRKSNFAKAQQYLDKSLALVEKYKIPEFYNTLTFLANLEVSSGNGEKALSSYQKSLTYMLKVGNRNAIKNIYCYLADYSLNNNLDKAKVDEYELAFSWINDYL